MIVVVDNTKNQKRKMFLPNLVRYLQKNEIDFIVFKGDMSGVYLMQEYIKEGTKIQGIILSGSPMMLNNSKSEQYALNTYCLDRLSHIPILGICFGCQLITSYFGGILTSLGSLHCEQYTVKPVNSRKPVFTAQFCCTYMPWLLPKTLKTMMTVSIDGHNYVCGFRHNKKNIYGLMFHPEKLASTHRFLDTFISKCKQ